MRTENEVKTASVPNQDCGDKPGSGTAKTDLTGPAVLILGSEDKGISRELTGIADQIVRIPMTGSIGSLNVSVAAGILIYEIMRQRSS